MNDAILSLEDIEFIKILANSEASLLESGMTDIIRKKIYNRIGMILRQYYNEHTKGDNTNWTKQFEKAGIFEDDGKSAIACARRLGIDIS